ncbi:MAG: hypothetical protein WBQ75_15290 [Acetobacteraceae bacterium]
MNTDGSKLIERLGFRPTQEDAQHIATIAAEIRAKTGAAFVNRTECLRAALRAAAKTTQDGVLI